MAYCFYVIGYIGRDEFPAYSTGGATVDCYPVQRQQIAHLSDTCCLCRYYAPTLGAFGIARSVRLSVPWRSCLGYRHVGCLQLSHRRPPEMCGLRTRPRTDVDPPRFLPPSNCRRRGTYRLAALLVRYLVSYCEQRVISICSCNSSVKLGIRVRASVSCVSV